MSTHGQVATRDYHLLYQRKKDIFWVTGKPQMPTQVLLGRDDAPDIKVLVLTLTTAGK